MKILSARKIKARNPETGEFQGINAFAAETSQEYLDKIQKKGGGDASVSSPRTTPIWLSKP